MMSNDREPSEAERLAIEDTMGGRIVSAREAIGLSTAQLARRLGVKSATMQNWENDRSEPRSNKLFMLSGLLNVSPTWLLNGKGDAPMEAEADYAQDTTSMRELLLNLRRDQTRITEQIDALIARLG